jgi:hypothetical protein
MAVENLFTLKGTLYSKDTRKVPNKKKPTEPDYEFYSIKVEAKILIDGRERTVIPELSLDRGVGFEEFHVGDPIEVDFYLTGKAISDTWYKSEAKVIYMKSAKLSDLYPAKEPSKAEVVFTPPRPTEIDNSPIDDFENLPF